MLAVTLLLAILAGAWSVAGTALAPVLPGGGWTVFGVAIVFTAIPLATLIGTRVMRAYPGAFVRLFVFRPFWYAQFLVLLLTLTSTAGAILGLPFGRAAETGRLAALGTAVLFTCTAIAGYIGSRRLQIRRFVATLPGLPSGLEGLVVAHLSDLHVGPHSSRRHLQRAAEAVRAAKPDLIAVTGDLIDDYPDDVARYGEVFGALGAPLGVYAIPGNHEVYAGWDAVLQRLRRLPVTMLVNRSVMVERNGVWFAVAGTGDPAFGPGAGGNVAPDIARTLADVPPDTFVLALAHNPALWPALAARGVDLTLSGHTHWGQLAFPRLGWSLASPFLALAMGAHASGRSLLYIHPGTGYWGLPFRLGHSAQVAIVRLASGQVPRFRDQGRE